MPDPDGSTLDAPASPLPVTDGRCFCVRCTSRTEDVYRMVGRCTNCRSEVLVLYRAGDKAAHVECPICQVSRAVQTTRLATEDEIPMLWSDAGPSSKDQA